MRVAIDTSPLTGGHSVRGIGFYTRYLLAALQNYHPEITILEKITDDADLVHYPFFDLYFLSLPLRKPKPTVVTVHDVIPLMLPDHFPAGIKGKLKLAIQKFSLGFASAIVTDSDHSKHDIHDKLGIPLEKIHVVYLAVDASYQQLPKDQAEKLIEKFHLPKRYVLFVGDVNYNKNIQGLIKAFAKTADTSLQLVLVGKAFTNIDIPETKQITALIAALGLQNRVTILGFVEDVEKIALYNSALAYVQPSYYEGFGLPVLEAFSCGTPVISSNRSSLEEIIGDAAFAINPDNLQEITSALDRVASDESLRVQLAVAGKERAKQFTQQRFADEMARVYESVLPKKS